MLTPIFELFYESGLRAEAEELTRSKTVTPLNANNQVKNISKDNINHNGVLINTDGIKSNSDISDKTSSMQEIRNIYNQHSHTENQGSPTSSPNIQM